MIAELGHYALVLALGMALVQGTLPFIGAARRDPLLTGVAEPSACAQFLFVTVAFAALMHGYVTSDFSIDNVAENSHSTKPLIYKISGTWGNHEGSLVLWVWILSLFGAAVALLGRNLPPSFRARVLGVQALIGVGFLAFMLFTSNPFLRLDPAPLDGRGLNPILQDPGLAFHPPMLYLGYVGLSTAYSFAVAALIEGRVDATWARWVRPWTLAAWVALTLGIALGSWWAYYELGWGGWWFWDPVENASFMPWLAATALLHSATVVEKRDTLKSWTDPARDPGLLAVAAGHLPGPLGRADLGARLRHRPDARRVHPGPARDRDRRLAAALRLARAGPAGRRHVRPDLARGRPAAQQPAAVDRRRHRAPGHALPAGAGHDRRPQDLGGCALLQRHLHPADGAAVHRRADRLDAGLEARRPRGRHRPAAARLRRHRGGRAALDRPARFPRRPCRRRHRRSASG